jgi:hypothetical protein
MVGPLETRIWLDHLSDIMVDIWLPTVGYFGWTNQPVDH